MLLVLKKVKLKWKEGTFLVSSTDVAPIYKEKWEAKQGM